MSPIYIGSAGERRGPYSEEAVRSMLERGEISEADLYWTEGMSDWRPLRELVNPLQAMSSADEEAENAPYQFVRNPEPLTTVLKVLLVVSFCTAVIGIASDWTELNLLSRQYTREEGAANDQRQQLVALLQLVVLVTTGIVFLKWIYRANLNSRGFGAEDMTFTPGWAIGCYFVPILNLFRPYQAMKEIWQVSGNPAAWKTEEDTAIVGVWWGLWIANCVMGRISFQVSKGAETLDALQAATTVSIIAGFVEAVLCVVALILVTAIAIRQKALVNGSEQKTS